MVKRSGSNRWLQRQKKDVFVKQAQQSHYRSRAVYKLLEINRKDKLFTAGQTIIDLGAAPGSWSQYASEQLGQKGKIIAVDSLSMDPIDNVLFIQGDFTEESTCNNVMQALQGRSVDLVISDMAPNLSGIKTTDQARSMYLAELVKDLACQVLKPGGRLLTKVFEGEGVDSYRQDLREHFHKVVTRKPEASRKDSREIYVLASIFKI